MNKSNPNSLENSSLRDVLHVLFRHRKKTFLIFPILFIGSIVYTFLLPEFYKSKAQLLVKLGRESVSLDPTATTGGQTISISQPREFEINSELEILKSRELAERVVEAIGAEVILYKPDEVQLGDTTITGHARDIMRKGRKSIRSALSKPKEFLSDWDLVDQYKEQDKAVVAIMQNLNISVKKSSNIIEISYEARTRYLAQKVVANLINFFLEKHIDVHRTSGSYRFFSEQTVELKNRLLEIEKSLRDMQNKTGIASLSEQRTMLMERINSLTLEKETTDGSKAASESKVKELERIIAGLPKKIEMDKTTGINNTAYGFMKQALYQLQLKEQDLLSKYTEQSPPVLEIRRQIKDAEAVLNTENPTHTQITNGINAAYQQIQMDLLTEKATLASLTAKSEKLSKQLEEAKNELKVLNNNAILIQNLERERTIIEENYSEYMKNQEQARIDQELQLEKISNISVVQQASLPMQTSRPNKLLNIFLGFFVAFFGSSAIAFFSEYFDDSIQTPEDVQKKLNLPTLVVIAKYPKNKAG